jgi:hypothetical protein
MCSHATVRGGCEMSANYFNDIFWLSDFGAVSRGDKGLPSTVPVNSSTQDPQSPPPPPLTAVYVQCRATLPIFMSRTVRPVTAPTKLSTFFLFNLQVML